jgi:anthranilate synthase component 2
LKDIIRKYGATKHTWRLPWTASNWRSGGTLSNLEKVYHGIATMVKTVVDDELLEGLGNEFEVGRYHSWVVDPFTRNAGSDFFDENGQVMSLRHRTFDVRGVQFHPESVLTQTGKILENWLNS